MTPTRSLESGLLVAAAALLACGGCSETSSRDKQGGVAVGTSSVVAAEGEKIPVTCDSDEAIDLYRRARRAADRLRLEEAHDLFARAVETDPDFALAHLGLADTSKTYEGYHEALERAAETAAGASDAERWWIEGQLAGARGNSNDELELYSRLAEAYPDDERVHDLLGIYFYSEQDFVQAAIHSRRACEIAPDFSSPWNNLGYSLMALGDFEAAEDAFRQYVELIPDEPNPYDSYGELLLKTGRYEESIAKYREALEIDPEFFSSRLAIGHNQIFLGRTEDARESFRQVLEGTGELLYRREALLGLASAALVDGSPAEATQRLHDVVLLGEEHEDRLGAAADRRLIGELQLALGRPDEALETFRDAREAAKSSERDEAVAEAADTRYLFQQGQVAVTRGDLEGARRIEEEVRAAVEGQREPAEVRRAHQLAGEIALAEEEWETALYELAQADRTSARVHWLQALAARGAGDEASARRFAERILERNEPYYGYAVYWRQARKLVESLE